MSQKLQSLLGKLAGKHETASPGTQNMHAQTPQRTLKTQYEYCAEHGYEFNNNLWGMHDAESGSQCTHYYGAAADGGGGASWGSAWSWKGSPNLVKSYVWANRQFTRPLLSAVRSLPTRAEWAYSGKNLRANVAYDIFTARNQDHANSSGEFELMIWLGRYGGVGPIGKALERVTLAGHKFDLHFGHNGNMKVYSFVAVGEPIYDFSGDVLDFFKHLAHKYQFPMSEQYMLIFQFGTEAFTGQDAEFYSPRYQADVNL